MKSASLTKYKNVSMLEQRLVIISLIKTVIFLYLGNASHNA